MQYVDTKRLNQVSHKYKRIGIHKTALKLLLQDNVNFIQFSLILLTPKRKEVIISVTYIR